MCELARLRGVHPYLRYLRQTRGRALTNLTLVAGADTDDMEADFVDIDAHEYCADDEA